MAGELAVRVIRTLAVSVFGASFEQFNVTEDVVARHDKDKGIYRRASQLPNIRRKGVAVLGKGGKRRDAWVSNRLVEHGRKSVGVWRAGRGLGDGLKRRVLGRLLMAEIQGADNMRHVRRVSTGKGDQGMTR